MSGKRPTKRNKPKKRFGRKAGHYKRSHPIFGRPYKIGSRRYRNITYPDGTHSKQLWELRSGQWVDLIEQEIES